jgi:hypothetical protein
MQSHSNTAASALVIFCRKMRKIMREFLGLNWPTVSEILHKLEFPKFQFLIGPTLHVLLPFSQV